MPREYQYDAHVKHWRAWFAPMEYYEIEWFNPSDPARGWVKSWSFIHNKTAHDVQEYLSNDIMYFYDCIYIRVVKVTKTVISNHKGSQSR